LGANLSEDLHPDQAREVISFGSVLVIRSFIGGIAMHAMWEAGRDSWQTLRTAALERSMGLDNVTVSQLS
jgi:hypothetical protein